jgi:hypothetical protein
VFRPQSSANLLQQAGLARFRILPRYHPIPLNIHHAEPIR